MRFKLVNDPNAESAAFKLYVLQPFGHVTGWSWRYQWCYRTREEALAAAERLAHPKEVTTEEFEL